MWFVSHRSFDADVTKHKEVWLKNTANCGSLVCWHSERNCKFYWYLKSPEHEDVKLKQQTESNRPGYIVVRQLFLIVSLAGGGGGGGGGGVKF